MRKITFVTSIEVFNSEPKAWLKAVAGVFADAQPNWPDEARFEAEVLFPEDGSAPREMHRPLLVKFPVRQIRDTSRYDPDAVQRA